MEKSIHVLKAEFVYFCVREKKINNFGNYCKYICASIYVQEQLNMDPKRW